MPLGISSYCLACYSSASVGLLSENNRKWLHLDRSSWSRSRVLTSIPVVLEGLLDFDSRSQSVKVHAQAKQSGVLADGVCNVHFDLVSQDLRALERTGTGQ